MTAAAGGTAAFSVTASGTGLSYQWYKNSTAISGATSASYTTGTLTVSNNGDKYSVTVTNTGGSVTSSSVTLTVTGFTLAFSPAAPSIEAGSAASVTVTATRGSSGAIQISGTSATTGVTATAVTMASSSSTATLPVAVDAAVAAGSYSMTITATDGTTTNTYTLPVTVTAPAASFTLAKPASISVAQGGSGTAAVTATRVNSDTEDIALTVSSSTGGITGSGTTMVSPATSGSVTINVDASVAVGSYTVTITGTGATNTAQTTLTVQVVSAATYALSGVVKDMNGNALAGVVLTLNDEAAQSTTTDSNGAYSFTNVAAGLTLTPSIASGGPAASFIPATLSTASADTTTANFTATVGFAVTGTVSYTGVNTGRVYITLNSANSGGNPVSGTSVALTGVTSGAVRGNARAATRVVRNVQAMSYTATYTIEGVQPGTYTVNAWMDTLGTGKPNEADPAGVSASSVSVTEDVSTASYTAPAVTLTDAATIDLSAVTPKKPNVFPYPGGAVAMWNAVRDSSGNELADTYQVQYSASSSFGSYSTVSEAASDGDMNLAFIGGLTDGTTYYFRIVALAGSSTSLASSAKAVVAGASTAGSSTVSGTITIPSGVTIASGAKLAVALHSNTLGIYSTLISAPTHSTSYSISGVPDGDYQIAAILDVDASGTVTLGDLTNVYGHVGTTTVSGATTANVDLTADNAGALANVYSQYWTSTDLNAADAATSGYGINFDVREALKLPVAVKLTSGVNTVPMDLAINNYTNAVGTNLPAVPAVGDTYALTVTFSDGTTASYTPAVTGVVDAGSLPVLVSPLYTGGATSDTPTFTWTLPSAAVTVNQLWVSSSTSGQIWSYDKDGGLGTTDTSALFNADGSASVLSLTSGEDYRWGVSVKDASGNLGISEGEFTVQ